MLDYLDIKKHKSAIMNFIPSFLRHPMSLTNSVLSAVVTIYCQAGKVQKKIEFLLSLTKKTILIQVQVKEARE